MNIDITLSGINPPPPVDEYPAIKKSVSGRVVIFFSEEQGVLLDDSQCAPTFPLRTVGNLYKWQSCKDRDSWSDFYGTAVLTYDTTEWITK